MVATQFAGSTLYPLTLTLSRAGRGDLRQPFMGKGEGSPNFLMCSSGRDWEWILGVDSMPQGSGEFPLLA